MGHLQEYSGPLEGSDDSSPGKRKVLRRNPKHVAGYRSCLSSSLDEAKQYSLDMPRNPCIVLFVHKFGPWLILECPPGLEVLHDCSKLAENMMRTRCSVSEDRVRTA